MSSSQPGHAPALAPGDPQINHGYDAQDFAQNHHPTSSPLAASINPTGNYRGENDTNYRGASVADGAGAEDGLNRASSVGRSSSILKKRSSVRRTNSLRRSSSKRSLKAGGLVGFGGVDSNQDYNSFAFTPVPTSGSPTEILANRFQAWRQLLKSLITYFREVQASYEARQKALVKVENTIANIVHPSIFMSTHGLGDATRILDDFHKKSIAEANKSRDIEIDVISALTGLRSDLGQKIKEIKGLSGDFKNTVEKEKDATRKAVELYLDALQHVDHDDGGAIGKGDPFVVKLGVERLVERQIDEENYLHRAYLNLESSGRELESIVVGEIQKAFNALASILKREGDDAYNTVDLLRSGPIALPKDAEWNQFVTSDEQFVDPSLPLRRIEDITYPCKDHPAAAEIRAGMLERKSKYLKSYTPGWYVLSPTHLHEFKSADKIFSQPPVMSLYLPEQKLGSRSQADSSSHKFILKGKQSGAMHKGHNWVFRAESDETMVGWYNDIQALTEVTGEQRNAYVRKHARSVSGVSEKGTFSSDGFEEDEADAVPYSADAANNLAAQSPVSAERSARPQPGGRFPSDLRLSQDRSALVHDGSSDSEDDEPQPNVSKSLAAAAAVPRHESYGGEDPYRLAGVSAVDATAPAQGDMSEPGRSQSLAMTGSPVVSPDGAHPEQPTRRDFAQPQNDQVQIDGPQVQQSAFVAPSPSPPPPPPPVQPQYFERQPSQTYDIPPRPAQMDFAQPEAMQAQRQSPLQDFHQQQIPSQMESSAVPSTSSQPTPARTGHDYEQFVAPAVVAGAAGVEMGVIANDVSHRGDREIPQPIPKQDMTSVPTDTALLGHEAEPTDTPAMPAPTEPVDRSTTPVMDSAPAPIPMFAPNADPAAAPPANTTAPRTEELFTQSPTTTAIAQSTPMSTGTSTPLGGNERQGAHATGRIIPTVRHESSMSVSALHVPGEYPLRE